MKNYKITYTLVAPNGKRDVISPIAIYASTENAAKQHLAREIQRRLGHLYRWKLDVQSVNQEQLILF
ncbi:hypothetical protein COL52_19170 [Bacillus toyonensis]|uniref:Uncharacterized protein n=2 Tax=Bacillus toyonensis TaxID=155322 RepID=A0A2B5D4M9_9BACI|nr:hypothetical protein [Bacillus toyonensis]PFY59172.1 hypothetical protein COL52_19170 [Bacillus toyonensis]PGG86379.1 hypothetical protein CON73_23780 [Bacillus toyonensis]